DRVRLRETEGAKRRTEGVKRTGADGIPPRQSVLAFYVSRITHLALRVRERARDDDAGLRLHAVDVAREVVADLDLAGERGVEEAGAAVGVLVDEAGVRHVEPPDAGRGGDDVAGLQPVVDAADPVLRDVIE